MTLALLLPLVASMMGFTVLDAGQPPDLGAMLQQFAAQFATETAQVLASVNSAVVVISQAAYVTLLLVGIVLYFTRVNRRMGKDFIVGGIALVILVQFLVPAISSV